MIVARPAIAVSLLAAGLVAVGIAVRAAEPPRGGDATTGRMLYFDHCQGCHEREIHWRDRRLVRDWTGLVAEVRRWQRNSGLAWSEAEILAVARHLNDTHYRLPGPGGQELAAHRP